MKWKKNRFNFSLEIHNRRHQQYRWSKPLQVPISALSQVDNAFLNKNLYFAEQWTGSTSTFAGNLKCPVKNVVIGVVGGGGWVIWK
jgi:hypothetical protein